MSKMNRKPPMSRREKLDRAIFVRKELRDLKTAEKLVKSVMRSLKTEPDRQAAQKMLVDSFEQLGLINFAKGRNGRSLYYFKRAIKLAKELDTPKSYTYEKLLVVSARVYEARGQYELVEKMYGTAIGRLIAKGALNLVGGILKLLKEFLLSRKRKKEAASCQRKIRSVEQLRDKQENVSGVDPVNLNNKYWFINE